MTICTSLFINVFCLIPVAWGLAFPAEAGSFAQGSLQADSTDKAISLWRVYKAGYSGEVQRIGKIDKWGN
jgi:hypothetical protein